MMDPAKWCQRLGHEYVREADLNDDYACWMCHTVKALTAPLPNDKVLN